MRDRRTTAVRGWQVAIALLAFSCGLPPPGPGGDAGPDTRVAASRGAPRAGTGSADSSAATASSPEAPVATTGPDAGEPTPPPPPAAPTILRVHDLTVERLKAGVVYAHKLDAKTGVVATRGEP